MKWFIGFFVLLVALVMISGCTQPAQTAASITTVPTPVPTTIATPVATTVAPVVTTTVPTALSTTQAANSTNVTVIVANVVPSATAASMVTLIHITSTGFNPAIDTVLPGTGISWVNDDRVSHTIKTVGINAGMFTSTDIDPNTQFQFDFGSVGIYDYILDNNAKITGKIIVKGGS